MTITEQPAITWSARPGERAHAFPATTAGWLRAKCGARWTVLSSEHGPVPRCGECIRVLALEQRDRRLAPESELERRAAWGDR